MKKIINNPEAVVGEMLAGMVAAHPDYVKKLPDYNCLVYVAAPVANKVGIISGGGSGHEPAHAGYIGRGMLDAVCNGNVFSSPTPDHFFAAAQAVDSGAGVLMVIKNYSGDLMNSQMAEEMAEFEDLKVARVIVDDDVAVKNSTYTTGRRGIAGTVFVHKIAGAKAAQGADLAEVKRVAEKVVANVRSMGMALTACIVPIAGKANFSLADDEMEIGMGIHGEPGIRRGALRPADAVVDEMLQPILADLPFARGDEVAVLVNGLGATPKEELYVIYRRVAAKLKEAGIAVFHVYVGEYATSMEMAGASISLLKLDAETKRLLARPAHSPFFEQQQL
jgi:dihydroxyacetone kinase-like protein